MNLFLQVYKKLGELHLAQMHFSWAVDLDPKGANNQIKEAVDRRYLPDDGDVGGDDVDISAAGPDTTNSDISAAGPDSTNSDVESSLSNL